MRLAILLHFTRTGFRVSTKTFETPAKTKSITSWSPRAVTHLQGRLPPSPTAAEVLSDAVATAIAAAVAATAMACACERP